jgi:hypothetical protein
VDDATLTAFLNHITEDGAMVLSAGHAQEGFDVFGGLRLGDQPLSLQELTETARAWLAQQGNDSDEAPNDLVLSVRLMIEELRSWPALA